MTRITQWLTAALTAGIVAGCATRGPQAPAPKPAPAPPRLTQVPPMPETGYTWRELVRHAVIADPDHAAILAEARAEYFRYKSKADLQDLRLTFDYARRDTASSGSDWDTLGAGRRQRSDGTRGRYGADLRFVTPNPFVDRHIRRTAEAAQREVEAEADVLKQEIALTVYELVQEALLEERLLEVLRAREHVLTEWTSHLKARQDAHVATQADVLTLDLQRIRLKATIQKTRMAAQAARRGLQVLTHIPDAQLRLDTRPPDWPALLAPLADEPKLLDTAFARSPDLAVARAAYAKARAMHDTAKARQIPWFAYVQAGYVSRDSDDTGYRSDGETSTSSGDSDEWAAQLAVNIPVFAWMSSEKKMAAAEMQAALLRETGVRQRIRNEIAGYVTDLRETLDILSDYRTALDALPPPTRETMPDAETFHKLSDTRLAATEYALETETHCALVYDQLLNAWETPPPQPTPKTPHSLNPFRHCRASAAKRRNDTALCRVCCSHGAVSPCRGNVRNTATQRRGHNCGSVAAQRMRGIVAGLCQASAAKHRNDISP